MLFPKDVFTSRKTARSSRWASQVLLCDQVVVFSAISVYCIEILQALNWTDQQKWSLLNGKTCLYTDTIDQHLKQCPNFNVSQILIYIKNNNNNNM